MFRILAVKEIIENPERYGYQLLEDHLYKPLKTYQIKVDTSISDLVQFAFKNKASYKDLKLLNPWLRKSYLTNKTRKTYYIDFPVKSIGKTDTITWDTFVKPPKLINIIPDKLYEEDSLISYTVKGGENLLNIAKKFKVKVPQIMQWNDMEGYYVKKGQTLKIYLPRKSAE
jgi:hypothetical protein